jgi:carboxyl-terminal processing protease
VSTVEGGSVERTEQRASRKGTEPNYPIVVLVNGSSASASEIVAGAIRNHGRGVVIGERTFGKGSVQHLYRHKDDSRLKLTVAKYLTPGDRSIQSVGVSPDIRLIPSVVEPPKPLKEADLWGLDPLPRVSLYWREWIDREADLDRHLEAVQVDEPPVYVTRYHFEQNDDEDETTSLAPGKDWEVQFAREIVLAAPNARRADMLRAADPVVQKYRRRESLRLIKAFDKVGIDWAEGENPAAPKLDVTLDFGEDGVLRAGEEEHVRMSVTNLGEAPVYQLSAVTRSENPWLDHREFYLGRIGPGETQTYSQRVAVHEGYGAEEVPVTVIFQDPDRRVLAELKSHVETVPRPLPRLEYSIAFADDGSGKSRGDGDGRPEVGEVIDLRITIRNVGEGATGEGFARLKNRSGRALDLRDGGVELGELRTRDGEICSREGAGCVPTILPGETFTARMTFALPGLPDDGDWNLDLQIGDNLAYDYGSIRRGGFYEFFQFEERIDLSPETLLPAYDRSPPRIDISRAPDRRAATDQVVISGEVLEDDSIRDVIIFHGEDKVFYRGGEGHTRTLPFSVERTLKPGGNNFYVLARDKDGLTATRSLAIWGEEDPS